jgi:hypothetical protein
MRARSILIGALCLVATTAMAQSPSAQPHCVPVGGTVMSNFISQTRTLGTATGDLSGAVSADLLGATPGADGTLAFSVEHHWVTESGDRVDTALPLTAVTREIAPGVFAVVSYEVRIQGGTGKYAGAIGTLQTLGEIYYNPADLDASRTVFRYSGSVCSSSPLR